MRTVVAARPSTRTRRMKARSPGTVRKHKKSSFVMFSRCCFSFQVIYYSLDVFPKIDITWRENAQKCCIYAQKLGLCFKYLNIISSHYCRCVWCWCVLVLSFILRCCGTITAAKQHFPLSVPYPQLLSSGPLSLTVAVTQTPIDQIPTSFWMTWHADASTAPPQLLPPTLQCPSVLGQGEGLQGVKMAPGLRSLWLQVFLCRMWPSTGQRTWSNGVTLMCLPEREIKCFSYPQSATSFDLSMLSNKSSVCWLLVWDFNCSPSLLTPYEFMILDEGFYLTTQLFKSVLCSLVLSLHWFANPCIVSLEGVAWGITLPLCVAAVVYCCRKILLTCDWLSLSSSCGETQPPKCASAKVEHHPLVCTDSLFKEIYDDSEDEDDEVGYADPIQDDLYTRKMGIKSQPFGNESHDKFLPKLWAPEEDVHIQKIKLGSQRRPWYTKIQGFRCVRSMKCNRVLSLLKHGLHTLFTFILQQHNR